MLNLEIKKAGSDGLKFEMVSHVFHGAVVERRIRPIWHLQLDLLIVCEPGDASTIEKLQGNSFPTHGDPIERVILSHPVSGHMTHCFIPSNGWSAEAALVNVNFGSRIAAWCSVRFISAAGVDQTLPFGMNEQPELGPQGIRDGELFATVHPELACYRGIGPDDGKAIGNPPTEGEYLFPPTRFIPSGSATEPDVLTFSKKYSQTDSWLMKSFDIANSLKTNAGRKEHEIVITDPVNPSSTAGRALDAERHPHRPYRFTSGDLGASTLKLIHFMDYDGYFVSGLDLGQLSQFTLAGNDVGPHPLWPDQASSFFRNQSANFDLNSAAAGDTLPMETIHILAVPNSLQS